MVSDRMDCCCQCLHVTVREEEEGCSSLKGTVQLQSPTGGDGETAHDPGVGRGGHLCPAPQETG